jgi:hypothetical protein
VAGRLGKLADHSYLAIVDPESHKSYPNIIAAAAIGFHSRETDW